MYDHNAGRTLRILVGALRFPYHFSISPAAPKVQKPRDFHKKFKKLSPALLTDSSPSCNIFIVAVVKHLSFTEKEVPMKHDHLELCLLFDFYGEMLTDKQRELFDLYYNEDLSLSEIAEHAGITRQGVRDAVVRAEHTLTALEDKLHLVSRYGKIDQHVEALGQEIKMLSHINANYMQNAEIGKILTHMQEHIRAITG